MYSGTVLYTGTVLYSGTIWIAIAIMPEYKMPEYKKCTLVLFYTPALPKFVKVPENR